MKHGYQKLVCVAALVLAALWLAGCMQTFTEKQPSAPTSGTASSAAAPSAVSETSTQEPASKKPTAVYYDFEDVLIPLELSVVQDKSMIVSTPGFTSGILMLKGRVDRRSLINFFNNNMRKDNWTMVSQIASPNIAILVFEKPMKSGVISIKSEHVYTYVEVGVAARINQGPLSQKMDDMFQSDLNQ